MPSPAPAPTPTPTPPALPGDPPGGWPAACNLSGSKQWALAQLQEWYLFPELLDTTVDPANYSSVQSYIDALVAPARAQSRDRYFTSYSSLSDTQAYYGQSKTTGYGMRLAFDARDVRLLVLDVEEDSPAFKAGIGRGSEIISVGVSTSALHSIRTIYTTSAQVGLAAAFGLQTAGSTRAFQVRHADSTVSTVVVTAASYTMHPVSPRFGVKVLDDGGRKVGYINLRTFIDASDPALRAAFADFRAQGITQLIVDLRYNAGGDVVVADLLSDLLNAQRVGRVSNYWTLRPSKSVHNRTTTFQAQPEAIAATRVAFIGSGFTASASEQVMNVQAPYLGTNAALIGSNTYGKPVGQHLLGRQECDDAVFPVALKIENANHQGDHYSGLAATYPATCRAADDFANPLGDPRETSIRVALDFLAGRGCTPIATSGIAQQSAPLGPLLPENPTAAQRDQPGLF